MIGLCKIHNREYIKAHRSAPTSSLPWYSWSGLGTSNSQPSSLGYQRRENWLTWYNYRCTTQFFEDLQKIISIAHCLCGRRYQINLRQKKIWSNGGLCFDFFYQVTGCMRLGDCFNNSSLMNCSSSLTTLKSCKKDAPGWKSSFFWDHRIINQQLFPIA